MEAKTKLSPIEILNDSLPDTPPVDVEEVARRLGLAFLYKRDLPEDVSGAIIRDSSGSDAGYTIHIDANDRPSRRRFTLAHEIAHYILHRDLLGEGVTDNKMYRSSLADIFERQANRMAAEILMPARSIIRSLKTVEPVRLDTLARSYEVSDEAMLIRTRELRLERQIILPTSIRGTHPS